jgi:hypothetical protein
VLVDIVQLRHAGRKLPRDVLLAAVPIRGELVIEITIRGYRGEPREPHQTALLLDPGVTPARQLLPVLCDALVKLKGADLVIRGEEHVRRRQGEVAEAYPQAWWCRIVD